MWLVNSSHSLHACYAIVLEGVGRYSMQLIIAFPPSTASRLKIAVVAENESANSIVRRSVYYVQKECIVLKNCGISIRGTLGVWEPRLDYDTTRITGYASCAQKL